MSDFSNLVKEKESRRGDDEAAYLVALGQRVRHLRALRGMSRKVLAATSGISERYLAQLEGGQGNLSITLLRRAAAAIGCPVEDMIGDPAEDAQDWSDFRAALRLATPEGRSAARAALEAGRTVAAMPPETGARIALIGLRGAGKSTLGRAAAEAFDWPFVELNREIEADKGFSAAEIFSLYGQDFFRKQEFEKLNALIARPAPMILATGGGIVAEPRTFALLLARFQVIWVKAAPGEHMDRVRGQGDLRPMANDRAATSELTQILASRAPLYARAAATLDTSGKSLSISCVALVALIHQLTGEPVPEHFEIALRMRKT